MKKLMLVIAFFSLIVFTGSRSLAQNFPTYHQLGQAKATLWRPTSGTPNIGIVVMHRTSNFLNLGRMQGNEQPGICSSLYEYALRQQRIASHIRANGPRRKGGS